MNTPHSSYEITDISARKSILFQLIGAYHFSSIELAVHQLRRRLPIMARSTGTNNAIRMSYEFISSPVTDRVPFQIKSVYPTGLARPKHTGVSTGHVWHMDWHMGVWSAV
ncbi:Unconventional myosin-IXa [Gossypium arboreum]|uniref:Unconventional myosin-IXa n=1 Tax=Gossypium arboreum TaxID=29729 RepID=A0A0B0P0T2_GOSAR|nr:Unconventional myosin-IXa [Gossypium arboreum]